MIGYYFYGRDPVKGYQSYNKLYSQDDDASCFSKMRNYTVCENAVAGNLPEKVYFYNFKSSRGRSAMIGKTTYNTIADSPMSGDRNTVFIHQYLFQGQDRMDLLDRPSRIFQIRPFCTRMEDILQKKMSPMQKEYYEYCFDDTDQNVFTEVPERWSAEELLQYFGLEGQRLEELLYTVLNPNRRVYLMLPENSREATDRAAALMRCIFQILPASLLETIGFQTYAFTYDDGIAEHYIPMEIRYVFVANTEKNRGDSEQCKKVLRSYIFCDQCSSGVVIPEEQRQLVRELKQFLLENICPENLKRFYDGLEQYLHNVSGVGGSPKEYGQLYRFCNNCAVLYENGMLLSGEEEVAEMIRILGERPQIWNEDLNRDLLGFVGSILDHDMVTPRFYPTVTAMYAGLREKYPEQIRPVVEYFSRKITDYPSLVQYLDHYLEKSPLLRAEVMKLVCFSEQCFPAVAEYEFRELMADVKKGTKSSREYAEQLWRKLEYMKNQNPVLASYVDVLKVVKSYLRTDLLDRTHTAQEVLDSLLYCQKMAEKNGLAQAYNFMLQTISEEYIQRKLSESHLKGDEIRVLKSWPQSLKGNVSMAKKMDSRLQVDAVVDKVQSVVRKGKMPDILNVLKDIKGDERRLLAGCDASETILTTILKLLADYADVKGKQKEKETVFDQMNAELLKLFPEQRDKILFNVMAAPLGGIPGMSSLYSKVGRSRDMEDIRPDMKKAIEDFFRMYEMGRADRKALKQEEAFLRKINVYPDRLMR